MNCQNKLTSYLRLRYYHLLFGYTVGGELVRDFVLEKYKQHTIMYFISIKIPYSHTKFNIKSLYQCTETILITTLFYLLGV